MEHSQDLHQRIAQGLSRIGLVLRHHSQSAAQRHGITPLQVQALAILRGRSIGLRVGELANELAVTDATVSDSLSALTSKGLISRHPDPEDHRATRLLLSSRGENLARELSVWTDFLQPSVEEMTETEATAFLHGLIAMIRSLERRGEIPISRMCVSCRYFVPRHSERGRLSHYCRYIASPIGSEELRIDCPDFDAAPASDRASNWEAIIAIGTRSAPEAR